MRVLELTAHVQRIRRRDGASATAAAAYRSCGVIRDERTGIVHDYRRKGGLEGTGLAVPKGAPEWAGDRGQLWNAAEMRERNGPRGPNAMAFRQDAIVAREFMFGFPAELSQVGRSRVAEAVARHLVDRYGLAADFAIHQPGKEGDHRNHHCHMLTTTRQLTADGLGRKIRDLDQWSNGPRHIKAFRAFLAGTMNEALAAEGQAGRVFVEHRSFKDRGSSQKATRHKGKAQTNARRQQMQQDRAAWMKTERDRQTERHREERRALDARHEQARAARATLPSSDTRAFAAVLSKESAAMTERHAAEDRQLDKAMAARVAFDRVAESLERRAEVGRGERDHQHERDGYDR
ncbi:MobA/MobL family protein [Methylobacterium sp. J-072]|uniref:MobA/MobL family protein n=1 Tax=Methylobacterium sp. J-072 TaxID=2836651 RepID=UPI002443D84B|nr:MobA/MobL family protein [Methylobacterium sp. J-072]